MPLAAEFTTRELVSQRVMALATERYKRIAVETAALGYEDLNDHDGRRADPLHGYYRSHCYLPLYMFCGEHLLGARLRASNIDASAGTVEGLERIVAQIRQRWPQVKIVLHADSGFCREAIRAWCEAREEIYCVLGLARNPRLEKALGHASGGTTGRVDVNLVQRNRRLNPCRRRSSSARRERSSTCGVSPGRP